MKKNIQQSKNTNIIFFMFSMNPGEFYRVLYVCTYLLCLEYIIFHLL